MHNLSPKELTKTIELISQERLSSYRKFFNSTDDKIIYGLYCWNETLSCHLMKLIGIFEISLRNRIHTVLSKKSWQPGKSIGTYESNDWYSYVKLSQYNKNIVFSKLFKKKQNKWVSNNLQPHQLISGVTFGFWPELFRESIDLQDVMLNIFENHHQKDINYWTKKKHIDAISTRLEIIGTLRNRIAHFEPLWKIKDIKLEQSLQLLAIEYPAPKNEIESIERLTILFTKTTQALNWISKERAIDFSDSDTNRQIKYLLSKEALSHFKALPNKRKKVHASVLNTTWAINVGRKENRPIALFYKEKEVGSFYPKKWR